MNSKQTDNTSKKSGAIHSLKFRVAFLLTLAASSLSVALATISLHLYTENSHAEHLAIAKGAANLAMKTIDADKVKDYIAGGKETPGWSETTEKIRDVFNNTPDLKYLYAYQIREDGCHTIFDLDEENGDWEVDDVIDFDESFIPILPDLLAGKEIEPIESNDQYGWLLSVYMPLFDSSGNCVLYMGADISMDTLKNYRINFITRIALYFSGIFILILAAGLWFSTKYLSKPINQIASGAGEFMQSKGNMQAMADCVQKIKSFKIKTGDEVERLYNAFSKMTEDTVSHIEDIRRQNETISKMQDEKIQMMQKYNAELEQKVEERTHELKVANEKAEKLLLNILPAEIAAELTEHPDRTIAKNYPNATVLFTDIVGFTKMSGGMSAEEVVTMLNKMISMFDERAKREGIEKIKTIGDAYMAASGLTENEFNDGALKMIRFARELMSDVARFNESSPVQVQIRCGINSGPLVAGVIGKTKFIYDIWGDTVNVASRMESTGIPMKIHVTETTHAQTAASVSYSESTEVEVKGKGLMKTYFV